jgi:hypothetical protein
MRRTLLGSPMLERARTRCLIAARRSARKGNSLLVRAAAGQAHAQVTALHESVKSMSRQQRLLGAHCIAQHFDRGRSGPPFLSFASRGSASSWAVAVRAEADAAGLCIRCSDSCSGSCSGKSSMIKSSSSPLQAGGLCAAAPVATSAKPRVESRRDRDDGNGRHGARAKVGSRCKRTRWGGSVVGPTH